MYARKHSALEKVTPFSVQTRADQFINLEGILIAIKQAVNALQSKYINDDGSQFRTSIRKLNKYMVLEVAV
jgi:hypothetical protein